MGLGERSPVDANKATEDCSSPLTNEDTEKAANCDKQESCSIPLAYGDTEKAANCDKQGTWQKLWSIKVRLIPVLVIITITIIIVVIIIAAVVPRSGEKSTTGTENPMYRYAECMDDYWIYYKGKCYYFSDKRDTWNNSQNYCKSHNSSLAIIDSKKELDFLNRHKRNENYWIGLSRVKDVSNWTWTNDTPYTETIFTIESLGTASGDLEHAFLNHEGVKSESGRYEKLWICNK